MKKLPLLLTQCSPRFIFRCMNFPQFDQIIKNRKLVIRAAAAISVLVVLFIVVAVFLNIRAEKAARLAEQQRIEELHIAQEKADKARDKVMFSMKRLIETGNAETALTVAKKHPDLLNDEMEALVHLAKVQSLKTKIENTSSWSYASLAKYYKQLAELEPDNEKYRKKLEKYDRRLQKRLERKLYDRVQSLPARNYKANMKIYKELVDLNPDESLYKTRYKMYKNKYDQLMKKLEKFGPEPKRTATDGYYPAVQVYLKAHAPHPETLAMEGCTDCYYTKSGWLVGCNYREKDDFGITSSQFKWFTITNGTVQKVEHGQAYTVN